jgi:tetratricopeptide (TPR) repeat protein
MEEKKEFEASMHKSGNVCCSPDGGISHDEPSLELAVEGCLSGIYPNLGGAYREVRACIENYVRFKKGFDLNDGFFYDGKETVKNKFAIAGVEQDVMDKLIPIYVRANPFVHEDPSIKGLSAERVCEEIAFIRECVKLFKEMKIDCPDFQNGLPFLYNFRNARLKALLDGSGDPKALDTMLKEKLFIFFRNMRSLEEGMKNRGIAIPDVKFKTAEDVYDYLAVRRTAKTPEEATREERERALEYYRKMADNGSFSACLVLGNYFYGAGEGEKAIDWYKRALNMDNSAEEISRMMAGTMLIISKRLIAAKEYAEALKLLDGMTGLSEAFVLAGDCYYRLGELDAAFEKYRLAEPSHILGNELKLFIATRLISADPRAAMEYFKLCDAPEKDIGIMMGMGECCLRLGELTSAVKYYRNATKLNEREPSEESRVRIVRAVCDTVTF